MTINWNTSAFVDSYSVYRATSGTGAYTRVKTGLADSVSSWTNTGLTTGVTYYYKMVGMVDGRESAFSNIVSAKAK